MNWRLIGFIVSALTMLVLWFLFTDALYCLFARRFDMFVFPFTAWLEDYPPYNYSQWAQLRWYGAAILPALLMARILWQTCLRLWPAFRGLYGDSREAGWWAMRRSGIRHRRKPF